MDRTNQNEIVIVPGSDVVGSDGAKVGTVREVFPDYFVVEKGFFFPTDYYIPATAVANADDHTVSLNVTKDAALSQGWETPPTTTTATTPVTDTTAVDTGAGTTTGTWATTDQPATATTADVGEHETVRVPLAEEELTATKRPVEQGGVRVTKDVEETEQTLDVPVRQEHVDVERRVVDRDVAPGDTTFQEGTIEVPVRGEEVDVTKRARVGEEVDISKQVTEETKQVSGTVRRERAHVEDTTGTENVMGVGTDNLNTTDTVTNTYDNVDTTDDNGESIVNKAKDKVEDVTRNRGR